jgi:hypothetical protein
LIGYPERKIPPPPLGGGISADVIWGKNIKREREKGRCKRKRKKGKEHLKKGEEKEKMGSKV